MKQKSTTKNSKIPNIIKPFDNQINYSQITTKLIFINNPRTRINSRLFHRDSLWIKYLLKNRMDLWISHMRSWLKMKTTATILCHVHQIGYGRNTSKLMKFKSKTFPIKNRVHHSLMRIAKLISSSLCIKFDFIHYHI